MSSSSSSSYNTFSYQLNDNTKAQNYNITTEEGTLTVTRRGAKYEITVEGVDGEKTYNGQAQSVSGLKETEFTFDGNKYTVEGLTTSNPSSTNVTKTANAISGARVGNSLATAVKSASASANR